MRKIIGFIGYKNSGKTTACNIIKSHEDGVVVQHNFKDGLIRELKQNFPKLLQVLSDVYNMAIDELFIVKPPAVRALMQEYGTEVRRNDDQNYWVDEWLDNLPTDGMVLVDDVRFGNEAYAIKSSGGILIRLVRKDMVNLDTHKSEVEQDSLVADYTIVSKWGEQDKLEKELCQILA